MAPNNRLRPYWSDFSRFDPAVEFTRFPMTGPLLSEEAVIHALLHERQMDLQRSRRSLWSKICRFVRRREK